MIKESRTFGNVTSGKLCIVERDKFANSFRNWPDCEIEVLVTQLEGKRSDAANRYYWGIVVVIARQVINEAWGTNKTKNQIHEILKGENNLEEHLTSSGRTVMIVRDTHDMPHSEFCEYVERCRNWLVDMFYADTPDPKKVLTTKAELKV